MVRALALQSCGYQVTVTELTGWEHSLKNELILARRRSREHRPSKQKLRELLSATGVRPKIVRELLPELLGPERAEDAAAAADGATASAQADLAVPHDETVGSHSETPSGTP